MRIALLLIALWLAAAPAAWAQAGPPAAPRPPSTIHPAVDPAQPCEACHAKDNRHGARFAAFGTPQPRCADCHPMTRWSPSAFNHSAKTKFPLTGRHAVITCRRCHRGAGPADFEDLGAQIGCKECHEHRTVHADAANPDGRYTTAQCRDCHPVSQPPPPSVDRFLRIVHGPTSSFPLVKGHKAVPCDDCHRGRNARGRTRFERESPECGPACHVDALHRGGLGARCTPCHVSGTWDALAFDHNAAAYPDGAAGYPLRGEHRALPCAACHPARAFRGTPRVCGAAGCHAADDAHRGQLGAACDRCHPESGGVQFSHSAQSAFRLDGAHLRVRCAGCHPSATFKPRPRDCAGCHPEPTVHRRRRGSGCGHCHSTETWRPRR